MIVDLALGLPLEEPPVVVPWRTALAAFPPLLIAARESPGAFPSRDWIARVRVFGQGFRLWVTVDERDHAHELLLEPFPDERHGAFSGEPPPAREQLVQHGPTVLRRRAQLIEALGAGSAVPTSHEVAPCPPWQWTQAGAEIVHDVRWITERGLDDGWLDDRIRVTPR